MYFLQNQQENSEWKDDVFSFCHAAEKIMSCSSPELWEKILLKVISGLHGIDLWSILNLESIQEFTDMGYQTLFIHNDERSLINTTHIGQFFAFKPYLLPISQSICILIFFPFQTWF